MTSPRLDEAFNSMLRTDYIALNDTEKLNLLADYYVDYWGYINQMVAPVDQLVVGRRGTGKTTLLYRALVECMRSWGNQAGSSAQSRTLGIYLDLVKCQSLNSFSTVDYEHFEHAFISEPCDAIREELVRSWPDLARERTLIDRVFKSRESRRLAATNNELQRLAEIIKTGLPRFVDRSGSQEIRNRNSQSTADKASVSAGLKMPAAELKVDFSDEHTESRETEVTRSENMSYRLTVADFLRVVGDLRKAAEIPYLIIFVDEFSSLDDTLQGRFTTLLKKILGNHSGVYIKLCGITDHYRLGSSIILQRDLFELSLDLDSFVERSGSLKSAMDHLIGLTKNIVEQRLKVYGIENPGSLFDEASSAYENLSMSAMGVPRTLGIVLKQAWSRAQSTSAHARSRIRRADVDYGIRYASRAYYNQMAGSARDNIAIPEHVLELWDSLLERAGQERKKSRTNSVSSSHFMVQPRYEERLKYLNMFFLVHLLEQGRTTKKEGINRSLYCFDYGTALENHFGWSTDKNTIRQQRFAYDDTLSAFDKYYKRSEDEEFRCPRCRTTFKRSQLIVAGHQLSFCPVDRVDLEPINAPNIGHNFTEEEIKIIGAIRSAREEDNLYARQVADDVGCYVQKVAKFGAKLESQGIISRKVAPADSRKIYFSHGGDNA
ncbi:hypothetical protein [Micromonospora sp. WMMD1082]|uniref:ORC-CDC6 family AAA ATPase n=1 Tax=Micromonospora sp. WMMD1082 TaxID=3016104 RepID=UPI002416C763|nr:hypothetical protein [Micromonospora sp. WMMD1082]MDG4796392.1 hypothetical protein [Micromonospora sp. WMMD1082]